MQVEYETFPAVDGTVAAVKEMGKDVGTMVYSEEMDQWNDCQNPGELADQDPFECARKMLDFYCSPTVRVWTQEGEKIVTLSDCKPSELSERIDDEDVELIDVLGDTPYWATIVGGAGDPFVDDDEEGLEKETKTYREWMDEELVWARSVLGE